MRSAEIFLSFEDRLDRERWLGAVALLLILVALTYAVTWWLAAGGWIAPATAGSARAFVKAALLVPWLALDWKRFHDHGQPGALALVCPALLVASQILDLPAAQSWDWREAGRFALDWLQIVVALWFAYALAFRAGTPGENRFGPDRRGPSDAARPLTDPPGPR